MSKLFGRQPNWTLRQLIQETDQAEQFLKDILKELCVYNKKGTNQGSYELEQNTREQQTNQVRHEFSMLMNDFRTRNLS